MAGGRKRRAPSPEEALAEWERILADRPSVDAARMAIQRLRHERARLMRMGRDWNRQSAVSARSGCEVVASAIDEAIVVIARLASEAEREEGDE